MAHTIGKFQYLLIERTYIDGKQIDEYFELADSEKIAIAMAEEWERGYNATQIAPNVLRAEFDTGFGTTETRELALLSVPVVTGVGTLLRKGSIYIVEFVSNDINDPYEETKAYSRKIDADIEINKILHKQRRRGHKWRVDNQQSPNIFTFYTDDNTIVASLYIKKIAAYTHDLRQYR